MSDTPLTGEVIVAFTGPLLAVVVDCGGVVITRGVVGNVVASVVGVEDDGGVVVAG